MNTEIVGLTPAIAYAQHLAAEAGQHGPDGNESYVAHLAASQVAGDALATGHDMQAAFAAAAAAATRHAAELGKQTAVQEAYNVNPDAGDKDFQTNGAAGGQAPATAAPADTRTDRPQPAAAPAADRGDGEAPAAQPKPPAEPMVRVNYSVIDTVSGNWRSVGTIDVAAPLAYGDDMTLVAGLTKELRRRGQLPSGTHIKISPRHPDRPPMGWVHYEIMDGSQAIGEGTTEVNLAKAPTSNVALAATITALLRSQSEIAHDWHVKVLERIN